MLQSSRSLQFVCVSVRHGAATKQTSYINNINNIININNSINNINNNINNINNNINNIIIKSNTNNITINITEQAFPLGT